MEQYFTYKELKLANGKTERFTLAFIKLKDVRAKWPEVYLRYSEVRNKDILDELDYCLILYTAYLCANTDKESVMTEDEFLQALPTHRGITLALALELTYPEKN